MPWGERGPQTEGRYIRVMWVQVNDSGRWHQTNPFNGTMTKCGLSIAAQDDRREMISGAARQCRKCWNTESVPWGERGPQTEAEYDGEEDCNAIVNAAAAKPVGCTRSINHSGAHSA